MKTVVGKWWDSVSMWVCVCVCVAVHGRGAGWITPCTSMVGRHSGRGTWLWTCICINSQSCNLETHAWLLFPGCLPHFWDGKPLTEQIHTGSVLPTGPSGPK